MSEYQYHEFCSISEPLSSDAREEMLSLSSRAKVGTHGAQYVYNYGDFRGEPEALLVKYFDAYFYIANWGSLQLGFKYLAKDIDAAELEKFCKEDFITCTSHDKYVVLSIDYHTEDGFCGWIDGEGMLPELLPLYHQIKSGDYQLLDILASAYDEETGIHPIDASNANLSKADISFLKATELLMDKVA